MIEQFVDGPVEIDTESGKGVQVRMGAFHSRLQTQPLKEFPGLPVAPPDGAAMLSGPVLRGLIEKVRYAVSERGQKYLLEGALMRLTDGPAIGMIATDQKRLSIASSSRDEGPEAEVILHRKLLDVLLGQNDDEVSFVSSGNHLFFTSEGKVISARVIEGKFPDHQRVMERVKAHDKVVTIDRAAFASAIKRVAVAAEPNQATYFGFKPGVVELTARSAEVGEATEVVDAEYDGPPLRLCASWKQVLDFLEAAKDEHQIEVKLKDEKSALYLSVANFVNVVLLMKG